MQFDLLGRLDNLRLPDGRDAIYMAVFEAVSNAKHAIEDKLQEASSAEGKISVDLLRDEEKGPTHAIKVSDNGIGLTPDNLKSFDTCDSRHKKKRGGKGIGRLIWLKIFSKIEVQSNYKFGTVNESISFEFVPSEQESLKGKRKATVSSESTGTAIRFSEIQEQWRTRIKADTLARKIAYHFLPEFVAGSMPQTFVSENGGDAIDVREFVNELLEPQSKSEFMIPDGDASHQIEIEHVYLPRKAGKELINKILLVGHGRVVDEIEIEQKFALSELPDGKAYVGIVRGEFLNERVDQTRTRLILSAEQDQIIRDRAISLAGDFLSGFLEQIRTRQTTTVAEILDEHPQLSLAVADIKTYVANLAPSMGKEQIGQNLFTLLYRKEQTISEEVKYISESKDLSVEIEHRAEELLKKVSESAQYRLAGYVVKRRQILDVVQKFLKTAPEGGSYVPEKAIHDLICPMQSFYSSHDYKKHNLWIVDDLLAYYQFFASDKPLKSFLENSDSTKEPDLVFFNPSGFQRAGTNDPVVIVEFKRPGDEHPSSNPIQQVLGYIDRLRGKSVKTPEGEHITHINDQTPFHCIVIMTLTKGARTLLAAGLAQNPTPDGNGYFGYSQHHRASLLVIDYGKMLKDAERRNLAFFKELGLIKPN